MKYLSSLNLILLLYCLNLMRIWYVSVQQLRFDLYSFLNCHTRYYQETCFVHSLSVHLETSSTFIFTIFQHIYPVYFILIHFCFVLMKDNSSLFLKTCTLLYSLVDSNSEFLRSYFCFVHIWVHYEKKNYLRTLFCCVCECLDSDIHANW